MIKATIQNSPYCTEIRFPCSETELSKKLCELGMNTEHLAPMATVLEIEPAELSVLEDCEVSLDALNFLGKCMDGMSKAERNQFLAVLSCDELEIGWGLKNIINPTQNLARYTLIEDTNDLERVGLTHMFNIRGGIPASELENRDWLAEEGWKLIDSGKGIDTEYGKLFVNEEIPFDEFFNGTAFPVYYYNPEAKVSIEISCNGLTELVELPCEDIAIKKALYRLSADSIRDCKLEADSSREITDEWWEKIRAVENSKDIFGLNSLLKTEDICVKQEQPVSIFNKEMARLLRENEFEFSESGGCIIVFVNGNAEAKIYGNGTVTALAQNVGDEYNEILRLARNVYGYCSVYEKAAPLKANDLSEKYRCLSEFNGTVLAAKNTEYGFEFVTWDRTFDGKAVCQGNYYTDYEAAKENFAVRSELIDKDKMFSTEELEQIRKCVDFTMENDGDLHFDEYDNLKKLNEKISESLSAGECLHSLYQRSTREQQQSDSPEMSM